MPVIHLDQPQDSSERAVAAMLPVPDVADELGARLAAAGHAAHLVGGSVRDSLLGRLAAGRPGATAAGRPGADADFDFATDALPEQVLAAVAGWAEAVWETGRAFGTIGMRRGGVRLEVTTYRSEAYDPTSRKPVVRFGETLQDDLGRRDFTVNAMAVSVPGHVFTDPFGGLADLGRGVLRTPATPEASFDDDPLRILRAARFVATLGLRPVPELTAAMTSRAERLGVAVSAERIRDELTKLMLAPDPVSGLELLVDTGVAAVPAVLPELPALRLEIDKAHQHKDVYLHSLAVLRNAMALEPAGPDLTLRLAALLHDIGKPRTRAYEPGGVVSFHHHERVGASMARRRLGALRFGKVVVEDVTLLIELHLRFHGYADAAWTDSAVRRYVTDAGDVLDRLHLLARSDCTTQNRRKAERLRRAYDDLEGRIAALAEQEQIRSVRPDLDGGQIMELLGLPPGREVGAARQHLLDLRYERGPLPHADAVRELFAWAAGRGLTPPPS